MRTYSRKKPVHYQTIEGVEALCRLCLGAAEAPVPIFADDADSVCTLPLRIMICVGLEMVREDCLPNSICSNCYNQLESCYTFRKKCEAAYQKLKSHLLGVKERRYDKALAVKKKPETPETAGMDCLLITFNEPQDRTEEPVVVVNLDNVQLNNLEELRQEKVEEIIEGKEQNTEVQMQDTTTTNSTLSTMEIQTTTSDLSLIMSTMLIELGVLRQEETGLALVDENLRTVELEGDDNTKVVLRLMEEDEQYQEPNNEEPEVASTLMSLLKKTGNVENTSASQKQNILSNKDKMKESSLTCGVCGKRLASRSVLARHRRVHSGERPHACRLCGRRFAQRAVMLRHELVHRENRPFKCGSCPKSFTQRGALAAHARRHAQPRLALHACAHCDKLFLYASGLSRHMAAHTGRVFPCAQCGRAFSDNSSLRRHARTAHAAPGPAPRHAGPAPRPALAPAPPHT